jgi:hypothetical protein
LDKTTIYCQLNLFAFNTPVYIINDEEYHLLAEANRDSLVDVIYSACVNDDTIDHIVLVGAEGEKFKPALEAKIKNNYNLNNVRIEVKSNV